MGITGPASSTTPWEQKKGDLQLLSVLNVKFRCYYRTVRRQILILKFVSFDVLKAFTFSLRFIACS